LFFERQFLKEIMKKADFMVSMKLYFYIK
jgi:hypothetical protein